MIEFTKREYANEYSVWCTEEDDLVGELWYDEEKGWHFSSFEYDTGYHINDLQDVINKVNELNNLVKDSEYFKHQKELLEWKQLAEHWKLMAKSRMLKLM